MSALNSRVLALNHSNNADSDQEDTDAEERENAKASVTSQYKSAMVTHLLRALTVS